MKFIVLTCSRFSLDESQLSRRKTLTATFTALSLPLWLNPANAEEILQLETEVVAPEVEVESTISTVFVAGATGASGQRVVSELKKKEGITVIAGVRNIQKAEKLALNTVTRQIDVTSAPEVTAKALEGADAVVCATGFVPGNPFQMGKAAHAVDNVGTKNLIEAAKLAGVKKFVLISSILTNGRAIGQEKSAGFVITNAFGGVLDEKLEAEQYLRASGLDYTIIRPGGLKGEAPAEPVMFSKEDTLYSGEISRDLVAAVTADAVFSPATSNQVLEIVEKGSCVPGTCPDLPGSADRSAWFM
ncbi:hypothetical protein CYMTET_51856 [Cymbomonas tetramitiformis]|uniref:NAD(P)-binding domain-containing protein n=1 Tax=Cymbomonas tetramitiformis TaxID=36881 RepID=A0AAE0BK60_9CHLO|nr:hypothetical protein CYMTET_51856 [Cymbomonas tetramitiformis]